MVILVTENNTMLNFDTKFILKLKKQEHTAFDEFYVKTVDIFFRYIKTHYNVADQDCYDVISTYYIKQREALTNIDPDQSFQAYVRTIFKNTIKDHFKKMTDMPFTVLDTEDDQKFDEKLEYQEDITELLDLDFKFEQIQSAIKKLDDTSKEIIFMRFIQERSTKEIANFLQISDDNTRKRLSRAIKALKKLLVKS